MQIESLKMYCDLVETESFTKAAEINKVTQSAVSQQVTSMERQFKTLLIERSKKRFRPTREGQLLYDYSKQIVASFDSLQNKFQEIKEIISGNIQVATIHGIGLHDLPPYLKKFLQACPNVNVHLAYRRYNQVYEEVLENMADLGFVAFPQRARNVEIIPLHTCEMVLICHPEHPLAKRKSIKPKELTGQSFVNFEEDQPTRKAIDKALHSLGVKVQQVMEFDNIETIKRAVEIDAGIAILPKSTVTQEVEKGTLAAVKVEGADLNQPWAVIYKENKILSPAMKQLISLLKGPSPA
jgi:LysR family transcriptional regulator, transcriptional activator of the cysJI operon